MLKRMCMGCSLSLMGSWGVNPPDPRGSINMYDLKDFSWFKTNLHYIFALYTSASSASEEAEIIFELRRLQGEPPKRKLIVWEGKNLPDILKERVGKALSLEETKRLFKQLSKMYIIK